MKKCFVRWDGSVEETWGNMNVGEINSHIRGRRKYRRSIRYAI